MYRFDETRNEKDMRVTAARLEVAKHELLYRFDETRNEKDMRVNAARLEEAKHELWEKQHSDPIIFKVDQGEPRGEQRC